MRRRLIHLLLGVSLLICLLAATAWVYCFREGYEVRWKQNTRSYNNQWFLVLGRHRMVVGSRLIWAEPHGVGEPNSFSGGNYGGTHDPLSIKWHQKPNEKAEVEFDDDSPQWLAYGPADSFFMFPRGYYDGTIRGNLIPGWYNETKKETALQEVALLSYRTRLVCVPYWCVILIFGIGPLWGFRRYLKRRARMGRGFSVKSEDTAEPSGTSEGAR